MPHLTKSSRIASAKPPLKYEASLIPHVLSLVVRLTVAPPCLNKGNLFPLRSSSFLHCLVLNYTLQPGLRSLGGLVWCGEGGDSSEDERFVYPVVGPSASPPRWSAAESVRRGDLDLCLFWVALTYATWWPSW